MKPRGPLMIEHRLIEKMLIIIEKEISNIRKNNKVDPVFIDTAVDFIRIYADRTHHGKEEDILFKALEKKIMTSGQNKMMIELIDEHKFGRKTTADLVEAKKQYVMGNKNSLENIIENLSVLVKFYPEHINKEDKIFFPETEKYFTEPELDKMLSDFWEFDKKMIHEKYNKLAAELEKR